MSTPHERAQLTIRGARVHNLANLDLDLPSDGFVVLVGPSGSGKSSLAFDTVHAEGQRRYLEAMSARLRLTLGAMPRPEVDSVRGLPPTLALAQTSAPTVGTLASLTELDVVLRVLFGRAGVQRCPLSGEVVTATPHDVIVGTLLGLPERTRLHVEAPAPGGGDARARLEELVRQGFSRVRVDGEVRPIEEVRDLAEGAIVRVVVDRILVGPDRRDRIHDAVRTAARVGRGVVVAVTDATERVFTDRPISFATGRVLPELRPALFRPTGADVCAACLGKGQVDDVACGVCGGTGLGDAALAVSFEGVGWRELWEMPLARMRELSGRWPATPVTSPLLAELSSRLDALVDVGLGHLAPRDRLGDLSAGELQRARLARQVGTDLAGVLYVLDEPAVGLDAEQVDRLVVLLRRLVGKGNGLLVVEHDPRVIAAADRVIEFGPGAGPDGGHIVFDGPPDALAKADTATGRWLAGGQVLPRGDHTPRLGWITVDGARVRNLTGDPIRVARGALNAFVGPSGGGKTAALVAIEAHLRAALANAEPPPGRLTGADGIARVLSVDELSARRTRRSMPATYVGLWDTLRELLASTNEARARGLDAARFSLNVAGGRCEACQGFGVRRVDLEWLPEVEVPCEVCDGRRFASDVLQVRWKGLDASQILDLRVDEAHPILAGHPRLEEALRALHDVGLGYLTLGQPSPTLSGGEARRLKLARELVRAARRGGDDTIVLLDDPTSGLHPVDVVVLHALLRRLADEGATVVLATHMSSLVAAADHVVRFGPGVGPDGGRVVSSGPPTG